MAAVCGTGSGNFPQPGDPDLNGSILNASPAFGGIDVVWTYPGLNSQAVAHTILFRSTNADPDTKVQHRIVTGNFHYDKVDPEQNVEYFYWIQIVSVNGTVGDLIGPASATARPTIEQMIVLLTGQISDGNLAQSLKEDIQRIDSLTTTINGETAERLSQYEALQTDLAAYQNDVDGVATLLTNEVVRLETDDTSQINQINVLGAKTDDNSALIISESEARADADSALAMTIDTLQASSAQTFYQDSAPDPSVVTLVENDIWVNTTEPADGSEPAYALHQWDGSGWFEQTPNSLAGTHAAVEAERLARVNRDGALAQTIDTVETSVGRKSRTFFQANPPVAENVGDLWVDTGNGNLLKRWTGSTWQIARDLGIALADSKAVTAQNAAEAASSLAVAKASEAETNAAAYTDGEINSVEAAAIAAAEAYTDERELIVKSYADGIVTASEQAAINAAGLYTDAERQLSEAVAASYADGIVTAEEERAIADATAKANAAELAASNLANTAQATADSKNKVFRQDSPPAENVGNLWFDSSDGDKAKRWNGSDWVTINLYTGNQVAATIEDYNATRVGYCMVNGAPDSTKDSKASCEATTGGVWLDMYAIADAVKGVQVTDGDGQVANVQQRMISYKNELGVLNSEYTVKVQTDVDGNSIVGGFGVATDSSTGSVEAGFDVDTFWVGKLGNKTFPFIIKNNETFIKEAVVESLTINKLQAEDKSELAFEDGKLKAKFIDVDNIHIGGTSTFSGSLDVKSSPTGGRLSISGDRLEVHDGSNRLRVRIGRL